MSMNRRLGGIASISIFIVFLLCLAAYILALPNAKESWQSQTETVASATSASIAQTQQVFDQLASAASTSTMIAMQTESARPTDTPTPTSTISPSECMASAKIDTAVSLVPGGGWDAPGKIIMGDKVTFLGGLDDKEWYPVKSNTGFGWVPGTNFNFDESCPREDSIFHLLSIINSQSIIKPDQKVIVADTFVSNIYGWKDDMRMGSKYDRKLEEDLGNDYRLIVRAIPDKKRVYSDSLLDVSNPQIAFSLKRQNGDNSSYVGIVFDSLTNSGSSFEVRILGGSCDIKVYEDGVEASTQSVQGRVDCNSGVNYIEIGVNGTQLSVRVNGQGPYPITLNKDYGMGNLSFTAESTIVSIGFIVVTEPQ